ncbi:VOC family protein [Flavobacterium rhizosphaerae]|uniref:VOC family protein n=1 Tax=Flavobacterium rhizosphaerae TaxID=3163298 RepID=A0ABW8YYC0_9FLAO
MNFTSLRIITADIQPLIRFYEKVTGSKAIQYTEDFAEFKTALATLAIGSTKTLALFGGDTIARPASNQSVILEFRVDDVDKIYEAQAEFFNACMVQMPTTMPWGNRSLLVRDPDGNLVNLFNPVTGEAKTRLGQ